MVKSCFGDILDKNAAIYDKIIAKWPIHYWGFDCAKEIDFSFHLYYRVFLKDRKIAYFALFLTKKTCLTAYFWTIWTYKMSKKHKFGLL